MTKPTPSPAPASGAETTYCAQCVLNGSGRFPMRDGDCTNPRCVLYMRHLVARPSWLALPTPPSDAGTSEREAGRVCARNGCGHPRHLHYQRGTAIGGGSCRVGDDVFGSCDCTAFLAAPAAEGPRIVGYVQRLDDPQPSARGVLTTTRHSELTWCNVPAAALPGAEAGTIDRVTHLDALHEAALAADGFQRQFAAQVFENESLRLRLAALTSEVRALREDAERWRAFLNSDRISFHGTAGPHGDYAHFGGEFWTRVLPEDANDDTTKRHREFLVKYADAARLASPSPTGAP